MEILWEPRKGRVPGKVELRGPLRLGLCTSVVAGKPQSWPHLCRVVIRPSPSSQDGAVHVCRSDTDVAQAAQLAVCLGSEGGTLVLSPFRAAVHLAGDSDLEVPPPPHHQSGFSSSHQALSGAIRGGVPTKATPVTLPPSPGFVFSMHSLKQRHPRPRSWRRSSGSHSPWTAGPGRWSAVPSSGGQWAAPGRPVGGQAGGKVVWRCWLPPAGSKLGTTAEAQ